MNDNGHILAELKKLTALAETQRKANKWSLTIIVIFLFVLPAAVYLIEPGRHGRGAREESMDWYDVRNSVARLDFDKAIQIGEKLILKTPQYPEAHRQLADAYLAAGDVNKAGQHYAEAFRLFPSAENRELVAAIEERIKSGAPPNPSPSAEGSQ